MLAKKINTMTMRLRFFKLLLLANYKLLCRIVHLDRFDKREYSCPILTLETLRDMSGEYFGLYFEATKNACCLLV